MKGAIYSSVATYLGAFLALFYPFIGLMIYINFAIVKPISMWYWSVDRHGPLVSFAFYNGSLTIGIAMLMGWLIAGLGNWNLGRAWGIVIPLLCFLSWSVVCTISSDNRVVGWYYVESMTKIVLPCLMAVTLVNSVDRLRQFAWLIALTQGYVAYEMNLSYYAGVNRAAFEFGGMDSNGIAVAMVTGVGLALFLAIGEKRIWAKLIAFAAALLMAHTVMFSWSRGGMVALIITAVMAFLLVLDEVQHFAYVALLVVVSLFAFLVAGPRAAFAIVGLGAAVGVLFLMIKKPKYVIPLVVVVLLGLRLAGSMVRERFLTVFVDPAERDRSAQSRLEFWGYSWRTMLDHPVTGVGPNNWTSYGAQAYGLPYVHSHSIWLETGAEMGFPGLLLLLAFYGICVARLWPVARGKTPVPDPWLRDAARMVIASLTGFAVSGSFISLWGLEQSYYITILGAATLKILSAHQPSPLAFQPEVLPDMAPEAEPTGVA